MARGAQGPRRRLLPRRDNPGPGRREGRPPPRGCPSARGLPAQGLPGIPRRPAHSPAPRRASREPPLHCGLSAPPPPLGAPRGPPAPRGAPRVATRRDDASSGPAYLPGARGRRGRRAAAAAAATAATAAAAGAAWPGALAPQPRRRLWGQPGPGAGSAERLTSPPGRPWRAQGARGPPLPERRRRGPGGGTARLGRRAQAGPSRRPRPAPPRRPRDFPGAQTRAGGPRTPRGPERPARPRPGAPRPASPSAERVAWARRRPGAEREPRRTPTFWGLRPFWEDPRNPRPGWASCRAEPPRPPHPDPRPIIRSSAAPRCVGSHDSSLSLNFASLASNVLIKLLILF